MTMPPDGRPDPAPPLAPASPLRAPYVLCVALAAGLGAGALETIVLVKRREFDHRIVWHLPEYYAWTAPLVDAALALVFALALIAAGRLLPRLRAPQVVYALAVFLLALAPLLWLASIAWWASALLALGVAVQTGRMLAPRPVLARRLVAAGLALGVLATIAGGVFCAVRDGRRTAALTAHMPAPRADAPNVLLVVLDTVRASALGLHGYEKDTTPELSRLASESIVFDSAIATTSWTLPTHVALLTGRHRHETQAHWKGPLEAGAPTLAEWFVGLGHTTGGFVANLTYCDRTFGLDRGFVHYADYDLRPGHVVHTSSIAQRVAGALADLAGSQELLWRKPAPGVFGDTLAWIDARGERPFFAFLNLYDAHAPYLPPEPYASRFGDVAQLGDYQREYAKGGSHHRDEFTPQQLASAHAAYDACIAALDADIGRFVAALRERGVLDRTVLVITSDHGEAFGEHAGVGHGKELYDESVRVPLLIRLPGGAAGGTRVAQPVSLRDVPATLQSLVDPGNPPTLPGSSLAPTWDAAAAPPATPYPVFARLNHSSQLAPWSPAAKGPAHAVYLDGHCVILRSDGGAEVFRHPEDAAQLHDIAATPEAAALIERARAEMIRVGALRKDS